MKAQFTTENKLKEDSFNLGFPCEGKCQLKQDLPFTCKAILGEKSKIYIWLSNP